MRGVGWTRLGRHAEGRPTQMQAERCLGERERGRKREGGKERKEKLICELITVHIRNCMSHTRI